MLGIKNFMEITALVCEVRRNSRCKGFLRSFLLRGVILPCVAGSMCGCGIDGQVKTSNLQCDNALPKFTRCIQLAGVGLVAPASGAATHGRLGHLAYDDRTRRLFIAAPNENCVVVLDLASGKEIDRITGLDSPERIEIALEWQAETSSSGYDVIEQVEPRLVVGCCGDNSVHVYSLANLTERTVVRIDGEPGIFSWTQSGLCVAFGKNANPCGLAFFDRRNFGVTRALQFPYRPVSIHDSNEKRAGGVVGPTFDVILPGETRSQKESAILTVDEWSGHVNATRKLDGAVGNAALFDDHGRCFVTHREPSELVCVDSHGETSHVPCVADCDDLFFNGRFDRVAVIGGGDKIETVTQEDGRTVNGAIDVFKVADDHTLSKIGSIPTAPGARTGWRVMNSIFVACPAHGKEAAKIMEFAGG